MPLYRFACAACGWEDDAFAAPGAPGGIACPACGARARRVWTPPTLLVAPAHRAVFHRAFERHEREMAAELAKPETQAKLKSGELELQKVKA